MYICNYVYVCIYAGVLVYAVVLRDIFKIWALWVIRTQCCISTLKPLQAIKQVQHNLKRWLACHRLLKQNFCVAFICVCVEVRKFSYKFIASEFDNLIAQNNWKPLHLTVYNRNYMPQITCYILAHNFRRA